MARAGYVDREDGSGNVFEVPVGVDGVNPVTPENPPLGAVVEEIDPREVQHATMGVDLRRPEVQAALRGERVGPDITKVAEGIEKADRDLSTKYPDGVANIKKPSEVEEEDVLHTRRVQEAARLGVSPAIVTPEQEKAVAREADEKAAIEAGTTTEAIDKARAAEDAPDAPVPATVKAKTAEKADPTS